jgi:hypothetical protein
LFAVAVYAKIIAKDKYRKNFRYFPGKRYFYLNLIALASGQWLVASGYLRNKNGKISKFKYFFH